MKWARHVAHLEKKRYAYWVLVEIPDRKRTLGQT
jgi:hypothetical protein